MPLNKPYAPPSGHNVELMNASFDRDHMMETFGPVEVDPLGKSQHELGAKLDAGKNRLGLVLMAFAPALLEVGRVGTYGAVKYTDNGWKSVPDGIGRYTDAMLRHLLTEGVGQEFDQDTEMLHASHAAWNALARLTLILETRGAQPPRKTD